jgi:hypothetical protein
MERPKTPQAKKRLSLLKDCQNTYGENDKSSRTSIRWRKSWVNRTYRHHVNQLLAATADDLDRATDRAKTIERHPWQKCADLPLGKRLLQVKTWEIQQSIRAAAKTDAEFLDKLGRYLSDCNLKSGQVAIILRRIRAVGLDLNSAKLDLTLADLMLLEDFLVSIGKS